MQGHPFLTYRLIIRENMVLAEAAVRRCSSKQVFLKISQNHLCETLAKVFYCELSEIFKNTFSTEQLRVTASILMQGEPEPGVTRSFFHEISDCTCPDVIPCHTQLGVELQQCNYMKVG